MFLTNLFKSWWIVTLLKRIIHFPFHLGEGAEPLRQCVLWTWISFPPGSDWHLLYSGRGLLRLWEVLISCDLFWWVKPMRSWIIVTLLLRIIHFPFHLGKSHRLLGQCVLWSWISFFPGASVFFFFLARDLFYFGVGNVNQGAKYLQSRVCMDLLLHFLSSRERLASSSFWQGTFAGFE